MIYISLDTDVWLYLLSQRLEEVNLFDELHFWILNNHVKVIIPENIVDEWSRNKDDKIRQAKRDFSAIYNLKGSVLADDSAFKATIDPNKFEAEARVRLNKLHHVFNKLAVIVGTTDEIILEASHRNLKCLAPNHTNDSFRDTVNIMSIVSYLRNHPEIELCFFCTHNYKDFSLSKDNREKLHDHLKNEFQKVGLKYIYDYKRLWSNHLRKNLPDYSEHLKAELKEKNLEEVKEKESTAIEIEDHPPSFLSNVSLIDQILEFDRSSGAQVNFVIGLMNDDDAYFKYVFKKANSPFWFDVFRKAGFYDSSKVPGPKKHDDGSYSFPSWPPLQLLERLSKRVGENLMKVEEIFDVVKEVSETKVDNPHLWHDIIKIVSNLPNRTVSKELLNYVPVWLNSSFRNSLPSHDISENFLPKFLRADTSKDDLEKAEIILNHILDLKEETSHGAYSGYTEKKYKTLIDLYWLRHTLIENKHLELIGEKLSIGIIYKLANNLRKMLFGQFVGKNLSNEFFLRFDVEKKNLKVSYNPDPDTELADATTVVIHDFQKLEEQELANQITEKIKGRSSGIEIELDAIEYFTRRFFTDHSIIWCTSLHKLKNGEIMRDETKMIHVHLLMELTRIKAVKNEEVFSKLKEKFLGNEYPQPIFKRILFYALSKTWSENKDVFWELVKNEDEAGYLSNSFLNKEIFYLLRENVKDFGVQEKQKLQKIIEKGPQEENASDKEVNLKYWQLQWYSAVKDHSDFTEKYEEFSDKVGIDSEHYETLGEVKTRVGSISPFTPEEIFDMGIAQLLEEIKNFNPGRDIDDPTYDGFGNAIMSAVAQKPNLFTDDLQLLIEAPFFYVYNFLMGFDEGWRNKKSFDWEKVLNFIYEYINTDLFEENKLTVKGDRLNMDKELIIHQIGRLITEGTKKDSNAFDAEYLPITKKILMKIVPGLEPVDDIDESNMDYPTYSLNSKAGKVLMALINYSLRFARVHNGEDRDGSKWDEELKELYEDVLDKNIIDGSILVGFYFPQFNYLDKEWTQSKVKEFVKLDEKEWKAFMGGYLWDYPARNKEIYELMVPHYKRSIDTNAVLGHFDYKSTVNHIAAFYLWGIEEIEDGELINLIIEKGRSEELSRIPNFFWEVNDQIKGRQREDLRPRILQLWQRILERVEKSDLEKKENISSNLSKFMKYFDRIDDKIAPLLKASAPFVNHDFNSPFFLEELNRLKNYSQSKETAKHIGDILLSMLREFTPDFQESDIKELVAYMYAFKEQSQIRDLADSICAEYAKRGKEFLRALYEENKN